MWTVAPAMLRCRRRRTIASYNGRPSQRSVSSTKITRSFIGESMWCLLLETYQEVDCRRPLVSSPSWERTWGRCDYCGLVIGDLGLKNLSYSAACDPQSTIDMPLLPVSLPQRGERTLSQVRGAVEVRALYGISLVHRRSLPDTSSAI